MSDWQYPGARWWRFDFHTHTPASDDFMQGCTQKEKEKDKVMPQYWLQKFMAQGIDCVAVTDHNSGAWVDELKDALKGIAEEKPDGYRPLCLFPGVEISVHGGVHLLAIFDPEKTTSDIDTLLGAIGYTNTKGGSDGVTDKTLTEVVDCIIDHGGVAIPAHVDKEKGLFTAQAGNTLEQALNNPNISAMELCDPDFEKPQSYHDKKPNWSEVNGSDTHNFRDNGFGTFTWIKMDRPSIEGLRLALIDGQASINRDREAKPNHHAERVVESFEVNQTKYIGREKSLSCRFSPFLNTFIGGRGSGKSSLLEFMRFVLRRDKDIPEELEKDSAKYFNVDQGNNDESLLTEQSRLALIYRKGETRYRLNWSADASISSLEVFTGDQWQPTEGVIPSLFPVYIYSQKQIFELAKKPQALLDIIDQDPKVDYRTLKDTHKTLSDRYKQIDQRQRDLDGKIAEEKQLKGELNDLIRQIAQIEKSGHKEILQNYRKRQQQLSEIENVEAHWKTTAQKLVTMLEELTPASINESYFSKHPDILKALEKQNKTWQQITQQWEQLATSAKKILTDWHTQKEAAVWMRDLKTEQAQYEQLRTQLEQQGIDPKKYPELLQKRAAVEKELQQIEGFRLQSQKLLGEKETLFTDIVENRKTLSDNRQKFLEEILRDNQSVQISVKSFGASWSDIEKRLRSILQCDDYRFEKDFNELKEHYQNNQTNKEQSIKDLKDRIIAIRNGDVAAKDKRFANHLRGLPQESINDCLLWFPVDNVKITFGADQQQIGEGSPGQRTAALLAFILSYGTEPLLLDQPEDDLDNELIYDLIVKQLRETKSKRQIIVVTHNANIVVNGDAEMVLPLAVAGGQTHINDAGSIQGESVRRKICQVLEGGDQAFKQRYKRIHFED